MLLKDVVKEQIAQNKVVLFSSHQMSYIEEFCDSIAILNSGKAALSGELHDIKRSYVRDRLIVRVLQSGKQFPESLSDFGSGFVCGGCCQRDEG